MVITVSKFEKAFLIHIYLQRVDEVAASSILRSLLTNADESRTNRLTLFPIYLSLFVVSTLSLLSLFVVSTL